MAVSGTSPAAPFAAASLEVMRRFLGMNSSATARALVIATARPLLNVLSYSTGVPLYGVDPYGRSAFGALWLGTDLVGDIVFYEERVSPGETLAILLPPTVGLTVGISWNDVAGSPFDSTPLVNQMQVWLYRTDAPLGAQLDLDVINNCKRLSLPANLSSSAPVQLRVLYLAGSGSASQRISIVALGRNVTAAEADLAGLPSDPAFPRPRPVSCQAPSSLGVGLLDGTGTRCLPQRCVAGYSFSNQELACVPASSSAAATIGGVCPENQGYDWVQAACVCPQQYLTCPDDVTVIQCGLQVCSGTELLATTAPSAAWQDAYYGGGADTATSAPGVSLLSDPPGLSTPQIVSYALISAVFVLFGFCCFCGVGLYRPLVQEGWAGSYQRLPEAADEGRIPLPTARGTPPGTPAEDTRRVVWFMFSFFYALCALTSFLCLLLNGINPPGAAWAIYLLMICSVLFSFICSILSIRYFIPAIAYAVFVEKKPELYQAGALVILTAFIILQIGLVAPVVGSLQSCSADGTRICGGANLFIDALVVYYLFFILVIVWVSRDDDIPFGVGDVYVRTFLVAATLAFAIGFIIFGISVNAPLYIASGCVFCVIAVFLYVTACFASPSSLAGPAEKPKGP